MIFLFNQTAQKLGEGKIITLDSGDTIFKMDSLESSFRGGLLST